MKTIKTYLIFTVILGFLGCSTTQKIAAPPKSDSEKVSFKAREYFLKGLYLQSEERYSDALVQFHKAQIFDTTSATIHNSLAENYIKLNEFEPAIYHLNKARKIEPENVETYRLLGEAHFRQRNDDEAIEAYRHVLQLDPYDDDARNFLFFLYEKTNQPEAKAELYKSMMDIYGKDSSILQQIVELYSKNKNYEQALHYLNQLIQIDSTDARNYLSKGAILELLDKPDEAIAAYDKASYLAPDDKNIVHKLGSLYRSANEYQKVVDLYTPLLEKDSTDMVARLSLAEAYYFLENYDKTREYLQPVENNKDNPWGVYDLLGRVELEQKNYDTAAGYFKKVIDLDKKNRFGWLFLGFTYSDKGDMPEAENTFRQAVLEIDKDATLWAWLGITLQRQEKYSEAIEPYQKAILLDPKNINALSSLPVVLEELDLFTQSDSIYEAGLKNLPDNALLLNNFAYSLSERDIRLDEALQMSQKAITLEPDNAAYQDTYGWIYYKLGQYNKAEEYILKSLELRPKSAVVLDHMGDVYFKMGKIDTAKKYWKMSIEIQPDNQSVLDKIANN